MDESINQSIDWLTNTSLNEWMNKSINNFFALNLISSVIFHDICVWCFQASIPKLTHYVRFRLCFLTYHHWSPHRTLLVYFTYIGVSSDSILLMLLILFSFNIFTDSFSRRYILATMPHIDFRRGFPRWSCSLRI